MTEDAFVPEELIEKKILLMHGNKVMLESDRAMLYNVSTKRLIEQVRRKVRCFPADFIFQLSEKNMAL